MHLPKQAATWGTFVEAFNASFWALLVVVALLAATLFHYVFKQSNFQVRDC